MLVHQRVLDLFVNYYSFGAKNMVGISQMILPEDGEQLVFFDVSQPDDE